MKKIYISPRSKMVKGYVYEPLLAGSINNTSGRQETLEESGMKDADFGIQFETGDNLKGAYDGDGFEYAKPNDWFDEN